MLLGEKIKARRKELGYNADFLAEKTGLSRSTIFRYEKGDIEKIPTDILATIAKALNTTPVALMGWAEDTIIQEIATIASQLQIPQQKAVLRFAKEQLEQVQSNKYSSKVIPFEPAKPQLYPVRGLTEVAAGLGFGYDDSDAYTVFTDQEPPKHDLATMINGDSMEPDYHNGDMLYLRQWSGRTFNGQLLVIAIEDRTYFKKVYQSENGLRLVSLNPNYDDIHIELNQDSHLKAYQVIDSFTPINP